MNQLVPFFPILFIGMWVLITFLLSRMGWTRLVAHYQYSDNFIGTRVGIISATINKKCNYKNCLILKYNEHGIYLKLLLIFSLFHKPVLIPWQEITEVQFKKILFSKYVDLVIGDPTVGVISISESVFNKIKDNISLIKTTH